MSEPQNMPIGATFPDVIALLGINIEVSFLILSYKQSVKPPQAAFIVGSMKGKVFTSANYNSHCFQSRAPNRFVNKYLQYGGLREQHCGRQSRE
jgi:hypothetical protein